MTCKYCPSTAFYYTFSPFKKKNAREYSFHIGRNCVQCHRWQKWETQTEGLMEKLYGRALMDPIKFTPIQRNKLLYPELEP